MMIVAGFDSMIRLIVRSVGFNMREKINFNQGWIFIRQDIGLEAACSNPGESVDLPHTWNSQDGQDGGNDYHRGACWYTKSFVRPADLAGKRVYLEFNGANSSAAVYFNGLEKTLHHGGYSTFRTDITDQLEPDNVLCVRVDNSPSDLVYPQFADFTFYGGLYRDVNLIIVSESHFNLDLWGGPGVAITTSMNEKTAGIKFKAQVTNARPGQLIKVDLADREGIIITQKVQPVGQPEFDLELNAPHLWQGTLDPYLYTARISLTDDTGTLDDLEIPFGIRTYKMDPARGFILNGQSYPLRGVARHQDRQKAGNAVSLADQLEDMQLIAEMGANTIRLAHYQHSQYFYDLCDRFGMVVWAEIPLISKYMDQGDDLIIDQLNELVHQNINHPSIVCWGLSNEITLQGRPTEQVITLHQTMQAICRQLNPSRMTTLASIGALEPESPLNHITDILSYNHYFGWYYGDVEETGPWYDTFHQRFPNRCIGISEYGCDANIAWHTSTPALGDYSEEYQACYHEKMLEQIMARPYLWATHVWNMFDFGADNRDCGQNTKGLVTFDRKIKKDSFYLYKAHWSTEKFVHICSQRYIDRAEAVTRVKVYSNAGRIRLFINDRPLADQNGQRIFEFDVPLDRGDNRITACAVEGDWQDSCIIRRTEKPNESYYSPFFVRAGTNWFTSDGSAIEVRFPDGYYSIKDKIRDLIGLPEAQSALRAAAQAMSDSWGGKMTAEEMLKFLSNRSFESIANNGGKSLNRDPIFKLNQLLTRIPKR